MARRELLGGGGVRGGVGSPMARAAEEPLSCHTLGLCSEISGVSVCRGSVPPSMAPRVSAMYCAGGRTEATVVPPTQADVSSGALFGGRLCDARKSYLLTTYIVLDNRFRA